MSEEKESAEKAAREYAWNWFTYHAGQRQSVFRFYLVMMGAATTGYVTTANGTGFAKDWAFVFGLLIAILSFLFWQLDERSRHLVNVAQSYLKIDEQQLSVLLGQEAIQLAKIADERHSTPRFFRWLRSFKWIYRILFWAIGGAGILLAVYGTGTPPATP